MVEFRHLITKDEEVYPYPGAEFKIRRVTATLHFTVMREPIQELPTIDAGIQAKVGCAEQIWDKIYGDLINEISAIEGGMAAIQPLNYHSSTVREEMFSRIKDLFNQLKFNREEFISQLKDGGVI